MEALRNSPNTTLHVLWTTSECEPIHIDTHEDIRAFAMNARIVVIPYFSFKINFPPYHKLVPELSTICITDKGYRHLVGPNTNNWLFMVGDLECVVRGQHDAEIAIACRRSFDHAMNHWLSTWRLGDAKLIFSLKFYGPRYWPNHGQYRSSLGKSTLVIEFELTKLETIIKCKSFEGSLKGGDSFQMEATKKNMDFLANN